jgi:hypothetical protein
MERRRERHHEVYDCVLYVNSSIVTATAAMTNQPLLSPILSVCSRAERSHKIDKIRTTPVLLHKSNMQLNEQERRQHYCTAKQRSVTKHSTAPNIQPHSENINHKTALVKEIVMKVTQKISSIEPLQKS